MPDFTLADAIKESMATAPANVVQLHTLEFRHPAFTAPIRVVCDYHDLSATLEASAPVNGGEVVTFAAFNFSFTPPEMKKGGAPEIEILIDNVTGDIVSYLDAAAQTPNLIEVTWRIYLNTDTTGPQNNPPLNLVVRTVTADVFRVRCVAGFGDLANRKFPNEVYDAERFPGLAA